MGYRDVLTSISLLRAPPAQPSFLVLMLRLIAFLLFSFGSSVYLETVPFALEFLSTPGGLFEPIPGKPLPRPGTIHDLLNRIPDGSSAVQVKMAVHLALDRKIFDPTTLGHVISLGCRPPEESFPPELVQAVERRILEIGPGWSESSGLTLQSETAEGILNKLDSVREGTGIAHCRLVRYPLPSASIPYLGTDPAYVSFGLVARGGVLCGRYAPSRSAWDPSTTAPSSASTAAWPLAASTGRRGKGGRPRRLCETLLSAGPPRISIPCSSFAPGLPAGRSRSGCRARPCRIRRVRPHREKAPYPGSPRIRLGGDDQPLIPEFKIPAGCRFRQQPRPERRTRRVGRSGRPGHSAQAP